MLPLLSFTEEVEDAIAEQRGVVALESTLLAHGLPPDRREEVATRLETIVRDAGATPATIAIIDGKQHVGLTAEQRARVIDGSAKKASVRDLAVAMIEGGVWATPVASTMAVAARAGLRVFATGGIGGVHRGAETTFDESADLIALARYPLAVVSAGAKAVLDLPRTLERLEMLGVPVVGVGTDDFPAFYSASSGLPLRSRVDDVAKLAALVIMQTERLASGGMLVVQPPPVAMPSDEAERLVSAALAQAEAAGVKGAQLTPFLLAKLDAASKDVLTTNIRLVEHNAALAARLAIAVATHRDD
ncbi:MAG: pseudouridine-5'-phosphate glycosidase [Deltaproteobacteria bacterium]